VERNPAVDRPIDFFFTPYVTVSERRRSAALRAGLAHGAMIAPHDPLPGQPVTIYLASNGALALDQVALYYTVDGSEPAGDRGRAQRGIVLMARDAGTAHDVATGLPLRLWEVTIPPQADGVLVRYRADGWSSAEPEQHWEADASEAVKVAGERGPCFAYSVDRFATPAWFADAVIYHIVVDRFAAGRDEPPLRQDAPITGHFGGTLQGVLEQFDYLERLGVTCLWLSPVFESPSHHGYDPASYHAVARRYGTTETLRALIASAHARGMRVLLDFVANHTSDEHPLFLAARADPTSVAARWYTFDGGAAAGYRAYAGVATMPELATDRPEVSRYLTDAALHWLGDLGTDGLRLDYVAGPSRAFWATFQRAIKRQFPEALTLGEITDAPSGILTYAGRMDACMDFALAGRLRRIFALREAPLADLFSFIEERRATMPALDRAILLDNHDMHRFLWLAAGDVARLRLASACALTLEGTPIIYYGTEVGLSQGGDAHLENAWARGAMLWGAQQGTDLLAYFQRLIALRRAHPALRRGTLRQLAVRVPGEEQDAAAARQVGAYLRSWEGDHVLVALNNLEREVCLQIALPDPLAQLSHELPENALARVIAAELRTAPGGIEVTLPALGAAIFLLQ
jgi:glycosidase